MHWADDLSIQEELCDIWDSHRDCHARYDQSCRHSLLATSWWFSLADVGFSFFFFKLLWEKHLWLGSIVTSVQNSVVGMTVISMWYSQREWLKQKAVRINSPFLVYLQNDQYNLIGWHANTMQLRNTSCHDVFDMQQRKNYYYYFCHATFVIIFTWLMVNDLIGFGYV